MRRRVRQVRPTIIARAPGVIDPAWITAKIPSAMGRKDFQIRMTLEHAVENKIMERNGRLQRITDDVVEIETRKARAFGKAVRVNNDERVQLVSFRPEWLQACIGKFFAGHIGENFHAAESKRAHRTFKFIGRLDAILKWNAPESDKPVRGPSHVGGKPVVDDLHRLGGDLYRDRVIALWGRGHDQLNVDAGGVEVA